MSAGPAPPRVLPFGEAAVLAEPAGPDDAAGTLALGLALLGDPPAEVTDVVPAHSSVLVRFDPARTTAARVAAWIRAVPVAGEMAAGPVVGEPVRVDVRYDGPDLGEVGRRTGLGPDGVVAAHTGTRWTVAFTGFAPGFGYLVPDDAGERRLDLPRRDAPRPRVPAGAVALAAGYTGVYPRESPGGWHLIGSTDAVVWDVHRNPPALLRPGSRVRFRALR